MPHTERLIPKTKNPPAKVKDPGVIRLVMEGRGVYNAKSDELLLLPEGAALFRDVSEGLKQQFFLRAGAQIVDCLGSDAAIRSIAERFIREYGDAALSFQEERGRRLHLTGWSATLEDAREKVNRLKEGLLPVMADRGIPPCFMESLSPCGSLYTIGGVQTESAVFDGEEGFACPQCGFGAFADSPAPFKGVQPGEGEELQPLKDIETPGANTIADLCRQLDITPDRTLKAMLYISEGEPKRIIAVFIRGDRAISLVKVGHYLRTECGITSFRRATEQELKEHLGEVAGYCGPVGMPPSVLLLCDESVQGAKNTVVGANRPGYHRTGCCFERDFTAPLADLAQWEEGAPCLNCQTPVKSVIWRKIAHFEVPESAADPAERLAFRDRDGSKEFPFRWSGYIDITNILLSSS